MTPMDPLASRRDGEGDGSLNARRDWTVTELNRRAKVHLEEGLGLVTVTGEMSNVIKASSGHWYFTLKDRDAQVRAAMFRNRAQWLEFVPKNGDHVRVRGRVTLFEARGDFQLNVEALAPQGAGDLHAAFIRLKERLAAEGLFDVERKRPLPAFALAVGIITSRVGAALHDVLTTLRRRAPTVPVVIYPATVQGTEAPAALMRALDVANQRREVDVLLLVRGGGAAEDLWAFNDEALARAISRSLLPVVSGIGHETDFTIADFVADVRAATPTAAAQCAVPDHAHLRERVRHGWAKYERAMARRCDSAQQRLDIAAARLLSPRERLARLAGRLAHATGRLHGLAQGLQRRRVALLNQSVARLDRAGPQTSARRRRLEALTARLGKRLALATQSRRYRLNQATTALEHLAPPKVLARGFAVVRDALGGIVRDPAAVSIGDPLHITLARGEVMASVTAEADESPTISPL
jgi:exodeoxyribonuclease VII large subunit